MEFNITLTLDTMVEYGLKRACEKSTIGKDELRNCLNDITNDNSISLLHVIYDYLRYDKIDTTFRKLFLKSIVNYNTSNYRYCFSGKSLLEDFMLAIKSIFITNFEDIIEANMIDDMATRVKLIDSIEYKIYKNCVTSNLKI